MLCEEYGVLREKISPTVQCIILRIIAIVFYTTNYLQSINGRTMIVV